MTIHNLCEQARNTACACGAPPGCPCVCAPQHYHYARLARAVQAGLIPVAEFAQVIHDADVFTGLDTVTDPEVADMSGPKHGTWVSEINPISETLCFCGRCYCGWQGAAQIRRSAAIQDCFEHLGTVTDPGAVTA